MRFIYLAIILLVTLFNISVNAAKWTFAVTCDSRGGDNGVNSAILGEIATDVPLCIGAIWAWNSTTQKYEVSSGSLASKQGFWVYASQVGVSKIHSYIAENEDISITKNWNLVGPVSQQVAPSNVPVEGRIWGWSGSYFDVETGTEGHEDSTLFPGVGYWIFFKNGGTISQ